LGEGKTRHVYIRGGKKENQKQTNKAAMGSVCGSGKEGKKAYLKPNSEPKAFSKSRGVTRPHYARVRAHKVRTED